MRRIDQAAVRFVRLLLAGGTARAEGEFFIVVENGRKARLAGALVRQLQGEGVLAGDARSCKALPEARNWLRRKLVESAGFAEQHRLMGKGAGGQAINVAESPLARLALNIPGGSPFLAPHHIEAAERIGRLFERAHLQPRMTMTYSHARRAGGGGRNGGAEMTDMAAEARAGLNRIMAALPDECGGVVMDVCGMGKGLQLIETERGWPRRSAKLVLRIGLEQMARHFGLTERAEGKARGRHRARVDEGGLPTQVG